MNSRRKPVAGSAARAGKPWSGADVARLAVMAERRLPVERIARKLQRTEGAVRAEAARRRIKMGPTQKPPYGAGVRPAGSAARLRGTAAPPPIGSGLRPGGAGRRSTRVRDAPRPNELTSVEAEGRLF